MDLVDLVVGIVVVTILVTVGVGVVTYVAYKLRVARSPRVEETEGGTRYFRLHEPPGATATETPSAAPGTEPADAARP